MCKSARQPGWSSSLSSAVSSFVCVQTCCGRFRNTFRCWVEPVQCDYLIRLSFLVGGGVRERVRGRERAGGRGRGQLLSGVWQMMEGTYVESLPVETRNHSWDSALDLSVPQKHLYFPWVLLCVCVRTYTVWLYFIFLDHFNLTKRFWNSSSTEGGGSWKSV